MNEPRPSSFLSSGKDGLAGKARRRSELLFDAQQLIVFRDAISARSRARFDLSRGSRHSKIRDKGVFSFAGTMRNNGVITGHASQFDGIDGFGDAANLVQLDQNGVGNSIVNATRQPFRVGDKQIVANQLN